MKLVLTAAKPQRVLLAAENGYVFLDGKWISCNDIICGRRESEHINQNQKTIECLKEIRQDVLVDNCEDYSVDLNYLVELIDSKIKELEGEKE